jgi:hypothetical protein
MSVKGGLVAHLKADAGVAAIVGTKVYPIPLPQGKNPPYLLYQRKDTEHVRDLSGASGLRRAEFQLDAYSTDSAQVETLAEAVRSSLDNWSGTWAGTVVKHVMVDRMADDVAADTDGGEDVLHRIIIDIIVWHVESTPN